MQKITVPNVAQVENLQSQSLNIILKTLPVWLSKFLEAWGKVANAIDSFHWQKYPHPCQLQMTQSFLFKCRVKLKARSRRTMKAPTDSEICFALGNGPNRFGMTRIQSYPLQKAAIQKVSCLQYRCVSLLENWIHIQTKTWNTSVSTKSFLKFTVQNHRNFKEQSDYLHLYVFFC